MLIWIIDEEWKDYDLEMEELQKKYPGVEIRTSGYNYEKDLAEFGYQADGILAQVYANIPAAVMERLERCKGIAVYGGGYDRIDTEAARARGISVTNISGYCAEDLADYVLAAMFFVNKRIAAYSSCAVENVRNGCWGAMAAAENRHRLRNETLLIVGLGVIGKAVAERANQLGVHVAAYDEYVSEAEMKALNVEKLSWEEGFRCADYVSINLKGCVENEDRIGKHEFEMMKNTAWLINTSRGRVVNERELIEAVKGREIEGAVLDVIKNEPPRGDEAILNTPGIYVTPHVSYISVESFRALKEYALQNLFAMLDGKKPRDLVN